MMPHNDAWLAGLYEGEGCITPTRSGGALLCIVSTDHDVLEKVQEVAGFGNIHNHGTHNSKSFKPHWKASYRWQVNKKADLRDFIARVYPYVGMRRKTRFEEILKHMDAWHPITSYAGQLRNERGCYARAVS